MSVSWQKWMQWLHATLKLSPSLFRAAKGLLPYEQPKLTAVALGHFDGTSFAAALERYRAKQGITPEGSAHVSCRASGQRGSWSISNETTQFALTRADRRRFPPNRTITYVRR
jgi:hypothetical protein